MTVRYLLCPGLVRSRTDGDAHHVGAPELARLYRVPMADCVVLPPQHPSCHRDLMALLDRVRSGELIGLAPRFDGDYRLPDA